MAYRAAALLLGVIFAAYLLTKVMLTIFDPFIKEHREAVAWTQEQQMVAAQRQEKAQLEGRIAWLNSPLGAFEESRRKGMIKNKAGEYAVTFEFRPLPSKPHPAQTESTPLLLGRFFWPTLALLTLSFLFGCAWLVRQRRLAQLRRPAGTLTPRSELQRRR